MPRSEVLSRVLAWQLGKCRDQTGTRRSGSERGELLADDPPTWRTSRGGQLREDCLLVRR